MRLSLLLCFLYPLAQAAFDPSPEDPLLLVQVVIRHAERGPIRNFTSGTNEKLFFRGLGQLTDLGIERAFRQGQAFRREYVEKGFIDAKLVPEEIYFRSSPVGRVLMSASSFAAGLFDRTEGGRAYRIPAIHTVEPETDLLLAPHFDCDGMWDTERTLNMTGDQPLHLKLWSNMQQHVSEACKNMSAEFFDALVSESADPKVTTLTPHQRACASDGAKSYLYKYLCALVGCDEYHNELRLRRVGGVLMKALIDNMVKMVACKKDCKDPRFVVYYTHDTHVLATAHILGILDFFKLHSPNFSSAIVLELRSSRQGPYVTIRIKDGFDAEFVDFEKCKEGDTVCVLDQLIEKTKPFIVDNPTPCKAEAPPANPEKPPKEGLLFGVKGCASVSVSTALFVLLLALISH